MKLYHTTPKSNLDSIRKNGLDPNRASGKIKGVWLHTSSKREWAVIHTANRHQIALDEVIVIEVEVPRKNLARRWRGLWTASVAISNIKRVISHSEIAESPMEQ